MTTRRSETTVVGAGTKRAQVTATVSLRLVDTETGEVVLAATGRSRKNNTLVKAPLGLIRIGTEQVDKEQVNERSKMPSTMPSTPARPARAHGRQGKSKR